MSKYASQSVIGYNSNPPPDDGTKTDANKVTWAKVKSKLADPALVLAQAMNTELVSAFALDAVSVTDPAFGAKGDATTDDLAAFDAALAFAFSNTLALYIPGVHINAGKRYRLSDTWNILNYPSVHIYGDGVASLLFIDNASGHNCITVDNSQYTWIERIGITGIAGSGHGIEYKNLSHRPILNDVWIGWMGLDAIRQTEAISARYTRVTVNQNNGYRPGGAAANGNCQRALYIPYNATGYNNDAKCSQMHFEANGSGGFHQLQVGDNNGEIQSFEFDGLIQGSQSYKEAYMRTTDGVMTAHVEPPVGVTGNYIVLMDRCTNTYFQGKNIQGDVQFSGLCVNSGLKNVRCCGIDISATSSQCFLERINYSNISTGPTGGKIIDRSMVTDITNTSNASNAAFATGDNSTARRKEDFRLDLQAWSGSAAPTGLTQTGGTLTREASIIYGGKYSMKMVMTGNLTQYLSRVVIPIEQVAGKTVIVEAHVYNLTTAGLAQIGASDGSALVYEGSRLHDTWERMLVSFPVSAVAAGFELRFTGLIGTVYWGDQIAVFVQ